MNNIPDLPRPKLIRVFSQEKLEQEVEELEARKNSIKTGRMKTDPVDISMNVDNAMVA